ncbi:MAG TPA: aldo/keto reductase, partial [Beijerinckiaceae bacterium]|nr:aldo/keto reductase [Beijerinckiaceae bacterium]
MEFRRLGNTGLQVSAIGVGCNNFSTRCDFEGSKRVVGKALDLGITFFDTADSYGKGGSEDYLGEILGPRRADIVLATKFCLPMGEGALTKGASRRYIMRAVEASLRRLRTDWIDLYQLHFPDPATPIEETLRALDDLVRQGKVRYIGCSNLAAWQLVDAIWTSRQHNLETFVTSQNQYSLLVRDAEDQLLPAIRTYGLGLLPYYPLAGGFLTGKYKRGMPMPEDARLSYVERLSKRYVTDRNWNRIEQLQKIADAHGGSLLDLAFGWLLAHP